MVVQPNSYYMSESFTGCNRCGTDISSYPSFYTIAKNGMMYGFFCSHDCASLSEINRHLQAFIVKVNATPASHKDLVIIPDVKVLKQYQEELEKRKLWKKYLS